MLVLARREHEVIMIGDDIKITVVRLMNEYGKSVVRLGIDAPRSISVHRKEVYDLVNKNTKRKGI